MAVTSGVETRAADFAAQLKLIAPCADLMGGTAAMRARGRTYIPQEDGESRANYEARLGRSVLRNVFAQTAAYNRGQVFSRQVVLEETEGVSGEALEAFRAWAEDVDRRGSNLTSWAGDAFEAGLVSGTVFCLVDFPSIEMDEGEGGVPVYRAGDGTWRPRTQAAEADEGWTPYLVRVDAANVLDVRAEWMGGRRVLTHFRFREDIQAEDEDNPWRTKTLRLIRAYWRDRWEVWRDDGESGWVLDAQGSMTLPEIPVAMYMPGRMETEFTATPAMMDLAWLNIRHWQALSEQYDLLAYARRPVWWFAGVDPERNPDGTPKPAVFGPGQVCYLPEGASLNSAGVDAASIEAGRQDLKDLEEAMASYGLRLLQSSRNGQATATEVERETRENNSTLRNWALTFQDFLENILRFAGMWMGMEDGPGVKVNDEFGAGADVDYLLELRKEGAISNESLSALLVRAGVLPDDFDADAERERIRQEDGLTATGAAGAAAQSYTSALDAVFGR